MYHYLAYGLGIHSAIQLFDIPVQTVDRDVDIVQAEIEFKSDDRDVTSPYIRLSSQDAILLIEGVGCFQVSGGNSIVVDPDNNANQALLQRYIIGACMALLLYQRSQLVLHASAIEINRQAVAFMGTSGAGKSSIAAAFVAAGHKMVVDDVTSIDIQNNVPYVYQGFPYIKLVNGTLALSNLRNNKIEYSDHLEDKTGFRIIDAPTSDRIPLACIFVIKSGEGIEHRQYDFQQSLIELVRHSLPPTLVRLDRSAHFTRCIKVVNSIPIFELTRTTDMDRLGDLVVHIESYISGNTHDIIT